MSAGILIAFIYPLYMFPIHVEEPEPMVAEMAEKSLEPVIEWLDFKATAYVSDCEGCTGYTKLDNHDVRNTIYSPEGYRVIAVDPNIIPLGSLVEIDANGEVFTAKAMDIGGAIKGRKIDLLVTSESEAFQWGVKEIRLRVVE